MLHFVTPQVILTFSSFLLFAYWFRDRRNAAPAKTEQRGFRDVRAAGRRAAAVIMRIERRVKVRILVSVSDKSSTSDGERQRVSNARTAATCV